VRDRSTGSGSFWGGSTPTPTAAAAAAATAETTCW